MTIRPLAVALFASSLSLTTLAACDADEVALQEETEQLEASEELEALEDMEQVEAQETDIDPFEGLTPDEIALLELEDGTDKTDEQLDAGGAIDDLTTTPDVSAASSCVNLYQYSSTWKKYAQAWNWCSSSKRVRMIWAFASDGPCTWLAPGSAYKESRWSGYVSELRSC